jgi:hypothetical protein
MTGDGQLSSRGPLAALRRFVRPRPAVEACELCSAALPARHEHLFEPARRRLLCCCPACAVLFSGPHQARFRRVPRRVEVLTDLRLSDGQWEDLHLPINLAFFYHSSPAGRVVAVYPGPAGATESLLSLEAWQALAADNPVLGGLEPDVEALLVNRLGQARDHYRLPIDQCFRLVGLLRTHWRGLSGGAEVWEEIGRFFAGLKEQSATESGGEHA